MTITPDGNWVVFRSNMTDRPRVCGGSQEVENLAANGRMGEWENPMKQSMCILLLAGTVLVLPQIRAHAAGRPTPVDWIDAATGHRVIRLSGPTGGSSLYFHQNTYTPEGDKLIFNTKGSIMAVDFKIPGRQAAEGGSGGARKLPSAWPGKRGKFIFPRGRAAHLRRQCRYRRRAGNQECHEQQHQCR